MKRETGRLVSAKMVAGVMKPLTQRVVSCSTPNAIAGKSVLRPAAYVANLMLVSTVEAQSPRVQVQEVPYQTAENPQTRTRRY